MYISSIKDKKTDVDSKTIKNNENVKSKETFGYTF